MHNFSVLLWIYLLTFPLLSRCSSFPGLDAFLITPGLHRLYNKLCFLYASLLLVYASDWISGQHCHLTESSGQIRPLCVSAGEIVAAAEACAAVSGGTGYRGYYIRCSLIGTW